MQWLSLEGSPNCSHPRFGAFFETAPFFGGFCFCFFYFCLPWQQTPSTEPSDTNLLGAITHKVMR